MIDYTFNENKGYSTANNNPRKKAYCISDKILVVIDESLVKRLSIDDEIWFEQEVTEGLLRIYNKNKGIGEVH